MSAEQASISPISQAHQSYETLLSDEEAARAIYDLRERETSLANLFIIRNPEETFDGLSKLREIIEKKGGASWVYARSGAALETSALQYHYPLLYHLPDISPLHRLWRCLQMFQGVTTEGDSLIIGSGTTIPEVVALRTAPPTLEQIRQFLDLEDTDEFQRIVDKALSTETHSIPPYLDGHVTAIEPNQNAIELAQAMQIVYEFPPDLLNIIQQTLGDVIFARQITNQVKHVVWNRLDPQIVSGHFKELPNKKAEEDIQLDLIKVLTYIRSLSPSDATLLLTIGRGNNEEELMWRKKFLELTKSVLTNSDFRTTNIVYKDFSNLSTGDETDRGMFGGFDGAEGFLFAQFN